MIPSPLVTVIVISYNSGRFIEETLESIRRQTYPRIELIVTDDASTDDTASIAEAWLNRNGDTFTAWKLLRSPKNGGITQNCNNGWRAAAGDWIKLIAADDLLLDNCIGDNVAYVQSTPGAQVVFSRQDKIDEAGNPIGEYFFPYHFFGLDAGGQLTHLLRRNYLGATSAFIDRRILELTDGFDPRYPMMEDLPLWTRLLVTGIRLYGLDKKTVVYRIHGGSIMRTKGLVQEQYMKANRDFDRRTRYPLARERSALLFLVIRFDEFLPRIQRKRFLLTLCYPFLWAWYRFSPYSMPRRSYIKTPVALCL
jgi:alpha-1,3-rhamnosyltransferase